MRRHILNLVLALISSLLCAGALEWWAAGQISQTLSNKLSGTSGPATSPCFAQTLHMGLAPIPGACDYNAAGMRATSSSLKKPSGSGRVLLLGDSVTEMYHVPTAVAQTLQTKYPGVALDVWNSGVSGYDTCSELWMLRDRGLALDPDVVVLGFVTNDFGVDAVLRPLEGGQVEYRLGSEHWTMPAWFLRSNLLVWGTLRYSNSKVMDTPRDARQQISRCLMDINAETQQHGSRLVVMLWPVLAPRLSAGVSDNLRDRAHQEGEETARELLTESGMAWIDLRPELERSAPVTTYRNDPQDSIHPDGKARQIAAEYLAKWIKEQGWLDHLGSQGPSQ